MSWHIMANVKDGARHKEHASGKQPKKMLIVAMILVLIITNAMYYAFTHAEGISVYGDDPNYVYLAATAYHGNFIESASYIFTIRLGEIYGIATFFYLFGSTNFTSGLWNIMSYFGIIIVTFLFVRLYYDDKAALTSAFLASVFPLVTKYAVNISDDIPLAFFGSLAILLFIYAERNNKKTYYFFSGILIAFSWLITYESGIMIIFLLLFAFIELLRGKVKINTTTIFFVYGIAILFLLVFIFSYFNSGAPFIVITENSRFYSAVGSSINGLPTIPTADTNLMDYINGMFQYPIYNIVSTQPIFSMPRNIWNTLFSVINPSEYGTYFYLLIPMIVILLVIREKRSFFFIVWFIFMFLVLEFGPMHVSVSLSPFNITYLLAHRILRFMLLVTVPVCAIMGITLVKLLEFRNKYLLCIGVVFFIAILGLLYLNNYYVSNFWYYWQQYPVELVMQTASYVKTVSPSAHLYLEGLYNTHPIPYSATTIQTYLGNPAGTNVDFSIYNETNCSVFPNDSYIIWSGPPHCPGWIDVFNTTIPKNIPPMIIQNEYPNIQYPITNVYYKR